MARILVARTGTTEPAVVARHGDYDDWFRAVLEPAGALLSVVEVHRGLPLPDPLAWDGLLLTGSPCSVRDEAPWMAPLAGAALAAAAAGLPVLGVCFGHQLLGEALGGRVERNPAGPEYGTVTVELTEAGARDPLFAGLPRRLAVQATHRDALVRPPRHALRLAGNANTPWQAFAAGPHIRCVQFHPELTEAAMADLLEVRGIPARCGPAPLAPRVLLNWLERWCRQAR